jgi:hypothetical protein
VVGKGAGGDYHPGLAVAKLLQLGTEYVQGGYAFTPPSGPKIIQGNGIIWSDRIEV